MKGMQVSLSEGDIADVPPINPPKPGWDWTGMARKAQEVAPNSIVAGKDVPLSRVKSVRMRTAPPFVQDDGRIIVSQRNMYDNDEGITCVEFVYFTWEPKKEGEA